MARRPALLVPGQKHAHDDYEVIMVEVMHQERLDKTMRRLDAEIARDERRSQAAAAPTPKAPRRPRAPRSVPGRSPRSRARDRRSPQRVRSKGAGKKDEQDHHDRAPGAGHAGTAILLMGAGLLAVAGLVFAVVVKVVRLLA